ncbi:LiaF transmembrane domain-containing protein [Cellvibrio japonicus]|uniref:LiaF transmembrane domain-containing protein n=1 Tax=Cellvibrio japonicus (strain Ueda107) TaxID=498211 RepID=B3PHJ6_CELJU|nr:hypothetical protein [Cellvibrio japonicus]ACE85745.1 hypothetical protein CJA_1996 [Cellvibrio japonicus Ueda107]
MSEQPTPEKSQESNNSSNQPPMKPAPSSNSNWALGLAIVAIGALLLARNLGVDFAFLKFHNWWAIFILLAAIAPLQQAISQYRRNGWGNAVANSLVAAGAIVMLALLFLLDLSLWTWWPAFLIVGGLLMVTSSKSN